MSTVPDAFSPGEMIQKHSGRLILLGVIEMILGFMAIASPFVAGVTVTFIVGVLLLGAGIVRCVRAFTAASFGRGVLAFVGGILAILCGVALLGRPLFGLSAITFVLAAYFLVHGLWQLAFGFEIRHIHGWGWIIAGGIISILLGLMIWKQWPVSSVWAIGTLVGIDLLFSGITMLVIAGAIRSHRVMRPAV